MPKSLCLLILCWLLCWSPLAQAGTYGLQVPRELYAEDLNSTQAPWIFSAQGIWERKSERYLQALPFELEEHLVSRLAWAEPWLLAKDGENEVHQALLDPKTGAKFLRRFPYGHPEARHKSWDLVHNGFWLATLNPMPDGQQLFWFRDLRTGQLAKAFSLPGESVSAWDLEGEYLAIARRSPLQPMLEIWHWPSGKLLQTLDGLHTEIDSVQLQGPWLAAIDRQRLCVWNWHKKEPSHCQQLKYGERASVQHTKERGLLDISAYYTGYRRRRVAITQAGQIQAITLPDAKINNRASRHPLSWYQPETGRFLQLLENQELRWWESGQSRVQNMQICQQSGQGWQNCRISLLAWQGERVLLSAEDRLEQGAAVAAVPSAEIIPPRSSLILSLNLNTGKIEHNIYIPPAYPSDLGCLNQQHWTTLVEKYIASGKVFKISLLFLNLENSEQLYQFIPEHLRLSGSFDCDGERTLVEAYDSQKDQSGWLDVQSQLWVSASQSDASTNQIPVFHHQNTRLYESYAGYLVKESLTGSAPAEILLHTTPFWSWQRGDGELFLMDYQQYWHRLDLQEQTLRLTPLQHLVRTASDKAQALPLSFRSSFFRHHSRQVLLYISPNGPVWVTDQGHFFRQGEIPDAEMPYLVDGLKSLDLPAQLESWPEVQRALQGLPPLKASGLKLDFPQEDVCQNTYGC